ncbi:hypothetical protein MRBLMS1_000391 [Massilia sp. LMS1-1-1.1]
MTDPTSTNVTIHLQEQVRVRLQDQILAWARDNASGRLRYIMELSERERGRACGCTCISCSQPLIAVNAAKLQWEKRPHFRHEMGAETHSCRVLSARAALLASLQEGDLIILPRHRRSATFQGLSGAIYEGWVEIASQQARVGTLHFIDMATAEVVLENGRRLQVLVTGSASANVGVAGDTLIPRIEIYIDDPALAEMSPEQLRERLVPAISAGAWCGHWPDIAGDTMALDAARLAAEDALDWGEEAGDLPANLRRESLLHREVKAILESAKSILVPTWTVSSTGAIVTARERATRTELTGAKLEKRLGRIIPDVIAQLKNGRELLIEVTVTNTIKAERLARIRAVNLATLEIDFSRMSGRLSRGALRELVLDNVAGKVWLHHPLTTNVLNARDEETVDFGPLHPTATVMTRQQMLNTPEELWANKYLEAVRELARLDHEIDEHELWDSERERAAALDSVLASADGLHVHGYPEALDHRLFDRQRTMFHRLMSIMLCHPVAYRYEKVWQVINSMLTDSTPEAKSWHALYHLAIKAREGQLGLTLPQNTRLIEWRNEVRASIKRHEDLYRRDTRYDRLFALIFPDLVPGLDNRHLVRASKDGVVQLANCSPETIDERFFRSPDSEYWIWAINGSQRDHELELVASRARIDGRTVGDTSIMYHLMREKHSTLYVSTLASIVAEKIGVETATTLRFLCRNGFISLSQRAPKA